MRVVRFPRQKPAVGRVPLPMPAVLRGAGGEREAATAAAGSAAGSYRAPAGSTWPGCDFGVRPPYPGETALSWAEALVWLHSGEAVIA